MWEVGQQLSQQKIELPAWGVLSRMVCVVPNNVPSGQTRARNDTESHGVALKAEMDHEKRRVKAPENHCVVREDNQ